MRLAVLLMLLLPATARAQRDTTALALPDSSYLALTLELPLAGTFTVSQRLGNNGTERVVLYSILDVRMVGCTLIWRSMVRVPTEIRPTRQINEIKVPLKALDPKRVGLRIAASRYRQEPTVMELYGYVQKRGERPIEHRTLDAADFVTHRSQFAIPLAEGEAAHRMLNVLRDAMQRCDSWNTRPIPAIRSP